MHLNTGSITKNGLPNFQYKCLIKNCKNENCKTSRFDKIEAHMDKHAKSNCQVFKKRPTEDQWPYDYKLNIMEYCQILGIKIPPSWFITT